MNILIVEDENLLARELAQLVKDVQPDAIIAGRTNGIASTVAWLQANPVPDLILMDIELGDGQCFDIFQQVKLKTPVIFTTAYDEYTLRAFKVNSIDYLLKPIKAAELKLAFDKYLEYYHGQPEDIIGKVHELISQLQQPGTSRHRNRFLVRQGQKMQTVHTEQIAYFTSRNGITYLVARDRQQHLIDYTLDQLEEMLTPVSFFRVNRQFIIAHDVVQTIYPWFNGKLKLNLSMPVEEDVLVSREKAGLFKQWMGG